ncbi:MAG: fumarylacetoacetate hydrolase family protein [Magnetovibrio sp.]|nr:fumarylacetoacetate hydrolase family protein [Magnetovibrio sp.]
MTPEAARAAAQMIAEARLSQVVLGPLPEACYPATVADGYVIQRTLHDIIANSAMGHRKGYKIGCTSEVMQDYLGIDHPCAGGILDTGIFDGHAELSLGNYHKPGVECEVAVQLADDMPANHAHTIDSVAEHVGAVMIAMEIVDNRYADYTGLGAATLIADDFFGAGCVLGEPIPDWRDIDLPAVSGGLTVNGEARGTGAGADIMGHPLEALAWLASHATQSGQSLKAGEIVLLGTIVQCEWIAGPSEVTAEISGLGKVTAAFS